MAKRPLQHILETESKNALNSLLSSEWVINYQTSDYGIDAKVQIFESDNSTPYFFFVQLKSTEKIKHKTTVSYSFLNKRLNEYREYPLPVLLVLFDSTSKELFYKWAHDFFSELLLDGKNKINDKGKSSVRFEQKAGENFNELLYEEVKEYYFLTGKVSEDSEEVNVELELNSDNCERSEIENKLKTWLRENETFKFIKFGNFIKPTFVIKLTREKDAIIVIHKSKKILYPFFESSENSAYSDLLLNSLKVILADSLAISGRRNLALDIFTKFFLDESTITSTAHFIFNQNSWAVEYAVKNRNLEAFEIADKIVGSESGFYAQMLAFSSQFITSPNKLTRKKYEQFLSKSIDTATTNNTKGISNYNLAITLKNNNSFRQAIIHYCKSARYENKYLEKSYWWAEIAGCFFLLDKFRWAEYCYRKAIDLKEERIPARYLLADALIYQGRFDEASEELGIYLNETSKPISNAVLVKWLAEFLINNFGDSKRNKIESNYLIKKAINSKNSQEQKSLLFKAIQEDPISNLAWLNYTICLNSVLNQEDFDSLLVSIILNPAEINLRISLIFQLASNLAKTKEDLNYFHLAILNESWRYKSEIEDNIRDRLPEKEATNFLNSIESLMEEADSIFLNEIPVALRNF